MQHAFKQAACGGDHLRQIEGRETLNGKEDASGPLASDGAGSASVQLVESSTRGLAHSSTKRTQQERFSWAMWLRQCLEDETVLPRERRVQ
eukprot:6192565-Pleurochrysis_carterae.AAC.2